jgi:HlyD family secretion protein
MKLTTVNAPKIVVSRTAGHLVKILVQEDTWVKNDMDLAYMESTADHAQALNLLNQLKAMRTADDKLLNLENIAPPQSIDLGELQNDYHNFYLAYLNYRAIDQDGIYSKRKAILLQELDNTDAQSKYIQDSYALQQQELALAETEYEKYKVLADKKIISQMELQQKEALLLAKRQSIPQMENSLLTNNSSLLAKHKELSEIDNQILEESKKFVQALNSFISSAENWKKQYVLTSPSAGKLIYDSFLQEGQLVQNGQEMFYVHAANDEFFGEMYIPQQASSKVEVGQQVLVKVRSYPYQEYGYLQGRISYISDIPLHDSVFFSRVDLIRKDQDSIIRLKPGIYADAEIITEDQSIFKRIWMNLTKSLKL